MMTVSVGGDTSDIYLGFFVSLLAHCLVALLLAGFFTRPFQFEEEIVYSVTLEGGKVLGGISQVALSDKKEERPTKRIEEPEKKVEKSPEKAEVVLPSEKKIEKKKENDKKEEKKKEETKKKDEKKDEKKKPKEDPDADVDKKYDQAMKKWLGESSDAGSKVYGAAKITGEKGGGGGVLRPPEFFVYKKLIEDKIKGGWNWFDTSAALVAKIEFEISTDGTVSNIRVGSSSGNVEFDDSAERAVAKADPLPPPPEIVYQFFKSVRMTFDPRE